MKRITKIFFLDSKFHVRNIFVLHPKSYIELAVSLLHL